MLEWYAHECRSPSTRIKIPSVVILHEYHRARLRVNFTKRNIFIRDLHRCQYCGKAFPVIELTCDHVLPRSHGGQNSWENIVTCCRGCNRRKGQRTDIRPLREPRELDYWEMVCRRSKCRSQFLTPAGNSTCSGRVNSSKSAIHISSELSLKSLPSLPITLSSFSPSMF